MLVTHFRKGLCATFSFQSCNIHKPSSRTVTIPMVIYGDRMRKARVNRLSSRSLPPLFGSGIGHIRLVMQGAQFFSRSMRCRNGSDVNATRKNLHFLSVSYLQLVLADSRRLSHRKVGFRRSDPSRLKLKPLFSAGA